MPKQDSAESKLKKMAHELEKVNSQLSKSEREKKVRKVLTPGFINRA